MMTFTIQLDIDGDDDVAVNAVEAAVKLRLVGDIRDWIRLFKPDVELTISEPTVVFE